MVLSSIHPNIFRLSNIPIIIYLQGHSGVGSKVSLLRVSCVRSTPTCNYAKQASSPHLTFDTGRQVDSDVTASTFSDASLFFSRAKPNSSQPLSTTATTSIRNTSQPLFAKTPATKHYHHYPTASTQLTRGLGKFPMKVADPQLAKTKMKGSWVEGQHASW